MTGYSVVNGGHLDDAVLMQLLDAEAGSPREARDHLGACESCAARMTKLERAAAMLRGALPDAPMHLDFASVRRRRSRTWLIPIPVAAAATFVLLASAAAATPPVRAWILRHLAPEATHLATAPSTPGVPAATNSGIIASFAPSDTALVIRIDRRQANGALHLDVADTDRISAQAVGGSASEELLVLPGQLRVANTANSVADYRITIPTSVRVVRVMLGGDEVAVVRVIAGLHRRFELR